MYKMCMLNNVRTWMLLANKYEYYFRLNADDQYRIKFDRQNLFYAFGVMKKNATHTCDVHNPLLNQKVLR